MRSSESAPSRAVLYAGRFQPPHIGHVATVQRLAERFGRVILVISAADAGFAVDNPLTGGERFQLWRIICDHHELRNVDIVQAPGDPSSMTWVPLARILAPPFDFVVAPNAIDRLLFEYWGYTCITDNTPALASSADIRARAHARDESWRKMVPPETLTLLDRVQFPNRVRMLSVGLNA
jgi:nicotinamide-nucleotide adenylyltransferase